MNIHTYLTILQYSFIGFILGYILSHLINNYLLIKFNKEKNKDINKYLLLLYTIYDLFIITISVYIIRIIAKHVPYILQKNVNDNDIIFGIIIGMGFVFNRSLIYFDNKIDILFIDYKF